MNFTVNSYLTTGVSIDYNNYLFQLDLEYPMAVNIINNCAPNSYPTFLLTPMLTIILTYFGGMVDVKAELCGLDAYTLDASVGWQTAGGLSKPTSSGLLAESGY